MRKEKGRSESGQHKRKQGERESVFFLQQREMSRVEKERIVER